MYPVYDLTTEGGQKALLQHLRGHNALGGSIYEVLIGIKPNADGSFSFNESYPVSLWQTIYSYVMGAISVGGSVSYADLSTNVKDAIDQITFALPVFGDGVLLCWQANLLHDPTITVVRNTDDEITINVSAKVVSGGGSLEYSISGKQNSDFRVSPLTCDGNKATPQDVGFDGITWLAAPCIGPNGERFYVQESDISSPLSVFNIENLGVITGHDADGYGADFNSIGVFSPGDNQQMSFYGDTGGMTLSPDPTGCIISNWDGDRDPLPDLRETIPEYDWDHPITEPYPEPSESVGLSATKKHFIRIS